MTESNSENQAQEASKNHFNSNEIKTLVKLTFTWIMEIKKSQNQLDKFEKETNAGNLPEDNIYRNMSRKKLEKYSLHAFVEEIDNIETLMENL